MAQAIKVQRVSMYQDGSRIWENHFKKITLNPSKGYGNKGFDKKQGVKSWEYVKMFTAENKVKRRNTTALVALFFFTFVCHLHNTAGKSNPAVKIY